MKRFACVALLALVFPASAWAHAALVNASPSFRQRLNSAPTQLRLTFDQTVKPLSNSIVVYTAHGRVVSLSARNGANARQVVAPLAHLARGPYARTTAPKGSSTTK